MGPENIEIDAQIQAGNSGSPLIRVSDGKVIGVTTVSWFNKIDGDLSKVGTRYDPNIKLTREFAVRFLNVEWKQMTYGQFIKWINAREDLIYFVGELIEKICFRGKSFVFENDLPDITLKGLPALNEQLQLIAKCDENLRKSIEHYNDMVLHNKNEKGATIARYGNTEFEFAKKMISAKTVDSYKVRQQVIKNVMNIVNVSKLLSIDEKTIFMKYLDKQLRDYNEQNKLQLKGKNLPDFQLEEKETQY